MSAETYNLMTQSQEITVAALTVLGGFLSLWGSTTIVYNIISKQKFKQDSYHRLLLGTCAFDVISSVGWIMHTFAAPKETSERYLAIGNVTSCSASAFLVQCAIPFMIYNASLAVYFLVSVRFNLDTAQTWRMERIMHAIGIVVGVGCAIAPLPLQVYNENNIGPGCWLNNYPTGCFSNPGMDCIRGTASSVLVGSVTALFPTAVSLIVVFISNFSLYLTVRAKTLATKKIAGRFSRGFISEHQQKQTKEIASQATCYVLVFLNSLVWQVALRTMSITNVITRENESEWTPLIALTQFFQSSAGFGFLLVFVRPRYKRFRGEQYKMTRRGAFFAALSLNKGKPQARRVSSTLLLNNSQPVVNPANAYLDDAEIPCRAFTDNRGSTTCSATGFTCTGLA